MRLMLWGLVPQDNSQYPCADRADASEHDRKDSSWGTRFVMPLTDHAPLQRHDMRKPQGRDA